MTTSNIALIIPLIDAQRNRKSGSKATELSKLSAARYLVPRGFVVSADAYRSHLWASGARAAATAGASPEDREKVRGALLDSEIPDDIWSSVSQAYERLSWQIGVADPPVAVRPSTLEESCAGAAFAGAYECFLNVSGPDALKDAIKRVWASVWSDKAAECRSKLDNPAEPAMAIIIQQMLDRGYIGSTFTADPHTGDPSRALIECRRAGEKDEPSRYWINLHDLSIAEKVDSPSCALSDDLIKLIVEKAILIEDIVPGPVEIGWGCDDERLDILQARSTGNLPPYSAIPRKEATPEAKWRRVTADPICHFSRSFLWSSVDKPVESRLIHGSVYSRADDAASIPLAKSVRKEISAGLQMLSEWENRVAPEIRAKSSNIIRDNIAGTDFPSLRPILMNAVDTARRAVAAFENSRRPASRFPKLLKDFLPGKPALLGRLLGGLKDPTVLRDARLQDLGDRFCAAEQAGKTADEKWWSSYRSDADAFARSYGYSFQRPGEMYDISSWSSWVEDIDSIFKIVGVLARRDLRPTLITLHGAAQHDSESAAAEAEQLIPGAKRSQFKDILRLSRAWLAARNEAQNLCALSHTALRLVLLEIGRRLREAGAIAQINDIFLLTLDDLNALPANLAEPDNSPVSIRIARRKHELWFERRLSALDTFGVCKNIAPANRTPMGIGCSQGTATGRARLVTNIVDAGDIENGDIMITESPMLAWTPFLALAGGLVCESGSELDSEIIFACNYAIPIVAGCTNALESIKDGRKISINGSQGTLDCYPGVTSNLQK